MQVRSVKKDDEGYEQWLFGHSFADYRTQQNQIMQDIYTAKKERHLQSYEVKNRLFKRLQFFGINKETTKIIGDKNKEPRRLFGRKNKKTEE